MNYSERARYHKERKMELDREAEESNTYFLPGKKITFYLLTAIFVLVLIDLIWGLSFFIVYDIPITFDSLTPTLTSAVISIAAIRMAYITGGRFWVWFILVGGILSIAMVFVVDILMSYSEAETSLFSIEDAFIFIAGIAKIIAMIFLLTDRRCKAFLSLTREMNKKLGDEMKSLVKK
jgi:hypothetical protein